MKAVLVAVLLACAGCGASQGPCRRISLAQNPDVHVLQPTFTPRPDQTSRAYIAILGHCFRIEYGRLVLFSSAEPELYMRASWRSSKGVAVRVQAAGRPDPDTHLSSDPPLSEEKILALLLQEGTTPMDVRYCPQLKR